MLDNSSMNKLTLEQLHQIANGVAYHAPVIILQRDFNDTKMDERSALLHRLWTRIRSKMNIHPGGYPNSGQASTHEQVFADKIKASLDSFLEVSMTDEEYNKFIANFFLKAFKEINS